MYTIEDLCDVLRLAPRTVRLYIQVGVLPRPHGSRRWARYGEEHMRRARQVRAARENNVTLADLAERFNAPAAPA